MGLLLCKCNSAYLQMYPMYRCTSKQHRTWTPDPSIHFCGWRMTGWIDRWAINADIEKEIQVERNQQSLPISFAVRQAVKAGCAGSTIIHSIVIRHMAPCHRPPNAGVYNMSENWIFSPKRLENNAIGVRIVCLAKLCLSNTRYLKLIVGLGPDLNYWMG